MARLDDGKLAAFCCLMLLASSAVQAQVLSATEKQQVLAAQCVQTHLESSVLIGDVLQQCCSLSRWTTDSIFDAASHMASGCIMIAAN